MSIKKYIIKICVEGTMVNLVARGGEQLAHERKELAKIIGDEAVAVATSFPESDPAYDFYFLTDKQFAAFNGKVK